jgi:hypothetical protein
MAKLGRIQQGVLDELAALRAQGVGHAPITLLAARIYGTPTKVQTSNLRETIRVMAAAGLVERFHPEGSPIQVRAVQQEG